MIQALALLPLLSLTMIPDRPETGFPGVSQFSGFPKGPGMGNGVAIAPRWVLSCGHGGGATHWIQDKKHIKIKRRIDCKQNGTPVDLALYELEAPVSVFYPPAFLPFEGKGGLRGKEVRMIGYGESGETFDYGYDGRERTGGRKRFVTNELDSSIFFTRFRPYKTQVVVYDIDQPRSKNKGSLGGIATKFEGGIGMGDSGSPWLLNTKGKWNVVAITVYTLGDPKHGPHAYAWGAQGAGVDLYTYRDWIKKTAGLR